LLHLGDLLFLLRDFAIANLGGLGQIRLSLGLFFQNPQLIQLTLRLPGPLNQLFLLLPLLL
jgi:hypothetical protein